MDRVDAPPRAQPDIKTCVVYAVDSGAILHVHTVTVFPGGTPASADELANEALELAQRHPHDGAQLAVRHITQSQAGELAHGARIDPASGSLAVGPLPPNPDRAETGKRGT